MVARMSLEDFKDSVARDLEALLNTRSVITDDVLTAYPECSNSIVTYGLMDFADRSLSSPSDRADICACLEKTIARMNHACARSRRCWKFAKTR